jgi:hypothetical protein
MLGVDGRGTEFPRGFRTAMRVAQDWSIHASFAGPTAASEAVISELIRAGLSLGTVMAMEAWKSQEVLGLLRSVRVGEATGRTPVVPLNPPAWPDASRLRGLAGEVSDGSMLRFSTQD